MIYRSVNSMDPLKHKNKNTGQNRASTCSLAVARHAYTFFQFAVTVFYSYGFPYFVCCRTFHSRIFSAAAASSDLKLECITIVTFCLFFSIVSSPLPLHYVQFHTSRIFVFIHRINAHLCKSLKQWLRQTTEEKLRERMNHRRRY